jgi:hypothetical protein
LLRCLSWLKGCFFFIAIIVIFHWGFELRYRWPRRWRSLAWFDRFLFIVFFFFIGLLLFFYRLCCRCGPWLLTSLKSRCLLFFFFIFSLI